MSALSSTPKLKRIRYRALSTVIYPLDALVDDKGRCFFVHHELMMDVTVL